MPNQELRFGPVETKNLRKDVAKLHELADEILAVAEEAEHNGILKFDTDGHRKFERGYKELRLYHRKLQMGLERIT
jgi:hypothetical protein